MSPETTAYLFAYFTGEGGPDDEAVRFAVSLGNDVLHWRELNGGRPVLRSTAGERGLRDPFLLRGSRDDGFYLLATDMCAWRNGWERTQTHGSRHIEVWQSADLVDWGEQRHLLVSPPTAGNSWAPKAVWDPDRERYAVYWAANLYPCPDPDVPRDAESSYNRMLISTTADFAPSNRRSFGSTNGRGLATAPSTRPSSGTTAGGTAAPSSKDPTIRASIEAGTCSPR